MWIIRSALLSGNDCFMIKTITPEGQRGRPQGNRVCAALSRPAPWVHSEMHVGVRCCKHGAGIEWRTVFCGQRLSRRSTSAVSLR